MCVKRKSKSRRRALAALSPSPAFRAQLPKDRGHFFPFLASPRLCARTLVQLPVVIGHRILLACLCTPIAFSSPARTEQVFSRKEKPFAMEISLAARQLSCMDTLRSPGSAISLRKSDKSRPSCLSRALRISFRRLRE
jgi:hypothetical protein